MKFVKMHGCGNDYVYLDGVRDANVLRRLDAPNWPSLVRRMSDRHKGIGSDGVIVVCPPSPAAKRKRADVRMRMFNADGSESEMCGNGVRCVAKFAHDRLGIDGGPKKIVRVQTGAGVLPIAVHVKGGRVVTATVDMGKPREGPAACDVRVKQLAWKGVGKHWGVEREGVVLVGVFVSMGNPHMVVFEPHDGGSRKTLTERDVQETNLPWLGPLFETHPAFLNRMNVHFAGMDDGRTDRIVMRTWERGSGITQACGTGACAVAVAGVLTGRCSREVSVELPGGTLDIRWDKRTGHVFMTGPATDVFEGVWHG